MHIYFSGIGGAGIGPLAEIAHQAGYRVSGSDKQNTSYIEYLRRHGIEDIHIGQTREAIAAVHDADPIDWYVYSSAVSMDNPDAPEFIFCRDQAIHMSKRDELLNRILSDQKLKLLAVAGTHGKTTTTAMLVWLSQRIGLPTSYLLPAKTSFGTMGHHDPQADYFIYECDEFDRNFLAFRPFRSLITGVSWDHHEIFPTREDYQSAFREFIAQSNHSLLWRDDYEYLQLPTDEHLSVLEPPTDSGLTLKGLYNRLDAWLVAKTIHGLTGKPMAELVEHLNAFPGLQRRMEAIAPNLYSDYAHTPEKIRGAMSVALEMAAETGQEVVVIYEPLTNRRQIHMIDDYKDCFAGAKHVYWLPSYLAREDPDQAIVTPQELISHLDDPSIASAPQRNEELEKIINQHLADGDMVVAIAGGGGSSLDDWLRQRYAD
ncbi:MAG: hypothetical protein JWM37_46 [Candidatus Saccharibacteria bacterium]|nr:hypothetical protein [Candidatus Saccharibacteria bacterium]